MKLYHISDLHFGKSIYGRFMLPDQADWTQKFLKLCSESKPDAVLIAGDVYDRAAPSEDAVQLLDHLITSLEKMDILVFMIAGNHDSGRRLSFGRNILAKQNIFVAGKVEKEIVHHTVEDPGDGYGPVTFWLLPYVSPEQVAACLGDDSIQTYEQAVRALIEAQTIDPTHRNVLVAHQTVVLSKDSKLELGGSEGDYAQIGRVRVSVYHTFDYVALGHHHKTYSVDGKANRVRYAGVPISYHFDEVIKEYAGRCGAKTETADQSEHADTTVGMKSKGVQEVILNGKGEDLSIRSIPIPPLHRMRCIEGTRDEVYEYLEKDPGHEEYIGLIVTDQPRTPEMRMHFANLLNLRESILMNLESKYSRNRNKQDEDESQDESKDGSGEPNKKPREKLDEQFFEFYREQLGKDPDGEEKNLISLISTLSQKSDVGETSAAEKYVDQIIQMCLQMGGEEE
ncbi:MAG: exonuclease subunit SbcD [Eubacterium sp.]|nr:exonuclease subunit SbcD [Eubacterium sp.]